MRRLLNLVMWALVAHQNSSRYSPVPSSLLCIPSPALSPQDTEGGRSSEGAPTISNEAPWLINVSATDCPAVASLSSRAKSWVSGRTGSGREGVLPIFSTSSDIREGFPRGCPRGGVDTLGLTIAQ